MQRLLSIIIPTIPARQKSFNRLLDRLAPQLSDDIQLIYDSSTDITIGKKRNIMMAQADAEYVCSIDDDDIVPIYYVNVIRQALQSKPDCCSLLGRMYDLQRSIVYTMSHSIANTHPNYWIRHKNVYYKTPNHLNVIKSNIAKLIPFEDRSRGEDTSWAQNLFKTGKLKKEAIIQPILYYYLYNEQKSHSIEIDTNSFEFGGSNDQTIANRQP